MFDPEGRMWVEALSASGRSWDVFDREGRLLGTLPAPERSDRVQPFVRNEHLYLVRTDSLDVQHVEVYRSASSAGGAAH